MTRIPPDLHRQVNLAASLAGKSLDAWVSEQLRSAVSQIGVAGSKKTKRPGKPGVKKARIRRTGSKEQHA